MRLIRIRLAVIVLGLSALLAACDGATVQIGLEGDAASTPVVAAGDTPAATQAAEPVAETPAGQVTAAPATGAASGGESGGSADPSPATAEADPTNVFETPGADWVTITSVQYGVTLKIPPGWERTEGYDERYSGPDGHILLNALGGTGQSTAMELCQVEANHKLMPFGSAPEVQPISGGVGSNVSDACLVTPSEDAMAESNHLALLRYPQPRTIGMGMYPFFGLYGTGEHIRAIVSSVQFTPDSVAPTPTPPPTASGGTGTPARIGSFAVSPQSGVPRGGQVQVSWQAEGDTAVLCQNFFRPNVTGLPASACQDVPVSGSIAVTMPADADTFFVEMVLLVSDTQRTFSEIQMVQLACEHAWFFADGPASMCPVYQPFTMDAVAQPFERGWMIYVEDMLGSPLDNLYALFDVNGPVDQTSSERYVLFQNPTQAETPDSLQPPAGVLAPDDLFYSGWMVPGIAEAGPDGTDGLGWAVGQPVSYRAQVQWGYHPHDDVNWFYLGGPDGQVFALDEDEQAPPIDGRLVGEWYLLAD